MTQPSFHVHALPTYLFHQRHQRHQRSKDDALSFRSILDLNITIPHLYSAWLRVRKPKERKLLIYIFENSLCSIVSIDIIIFFLKVKSKYALKFKCFIQYINRLENYIQGQFRMKRAGTFLEQFGSSIAKFMSFCLLDIFSLFKNKNNKRSTTATTAVSWKFVIGNLCLISNDEIPTSRYFNYFVSYHSINQPHHHVFQLSYLILNKNNISGRDIRHN